jgi:steroid 5-alpha reductase family enzyme
VMIAAWALRLGGHIAHRSSGIQDDPRYAQLIEGWGTDARKQMFVLLQKQALVSIPLAMTLFLSAHNPEPLWRVLDVAALSLVALAAAGEAIADHQLRGFRSMHPQRTAVCDEGLWAWSRHPNYFFEWLMWVAFALLAIDYSLIGWLAIAGPLAIYWLLTQVSGIPPLEEHMLRTRGEAFRRYQARTSAFFPLPPGCAAKTGTRS